MNFKRKKTVYNTYLVRKSNKYKILIKIMNTKLQYIKNIRNELKKSYKINLIK